jgi:hypothetical protein
MGYLPRRDANIKVRLKEIGDEKVDLFRFSQNRDY